MHDIIFISNGTLEQDKLYSEFKKKFFLAKKASSYNEAKRKAFTNLFWLVWPDLNISDNFKFDYQMPDWDREYIHIFKNSDLYTGVCLCSKLAEVSEKEFNYRFFVSKKEIDIQASTPRHYDIFYIDTYEDYLKAAESSTLDMFWVVYSDLQVSDNFKFDFHISLHDTYNKNITHIFKNGEYYDGICLFPKNKLITKREFDNRFFVDKKEIDVQASIPKLFDVCYINTYEDYLKNIKLVTTEMFWVVYDDLVVDPNFKFDYQVPKHDQHITHIFKNGEYYDGVCLFSKTKPVTKREFDNRFFIDKKEIDIQASTPKLYDVFYANTFEEYSNAVKQSTTDMFWVVYNDLEVSSSFNFSYHIPSYDTYNKNITHVFKNGEYYDGICLFSTSTLISKREFDHRFFVNKNQVDIKASTPKQYDIVFISYNEIHADENYATLKERFPRAKRVHGVKGIHQAHIAAAEISSTPLFWVVDGDAIIDNQFDFSLTIPMYDKDVVHVWRSRNPVTKLEYGYGGVKLLPRKETLEMNVSSPDMTTSISSKFKAMNSVSNITAFNTDPFSTWRSAFRECVKLSSKTIQGQIDTETDERLTAWCTLNDDVKYGFYAYSGALAGRAYGEKNASDKEALRKINDFTWLEVLWLEEKSQLSL